jgi:CheY-like chemotaxis protein
MSESNPLRRDAAEIERAVERAGELTHQLLAIAGRRVERTGLFDLNTLVARLEPSLRDACGEARLRLALADGLPAVRSSPDQLQEIVVLLVRSAASSVRGGGTVTVETAVERAGDSTWVKLIVRDSGPTLTSGALERIFEPFPVGVGGRGPGLELPTVYGLVTQNGGRLEVTSDPAGQTAFAVALPAEPHAAGSPLVRSDRETILLAEDEPVVRDVVRETLERRGYVVLDGGDAPQALALAAGHRGRIDLLLSDVSMPGMNGVELAERLREQRPGLPVLLMSGAPETDVIGHIASEPGICFIAKPVTSTALLDAVRAAIAATEGPITV